MFPAQKVTPADERRKWRQRLGLAGATAAVGVTIAIWAYDAAGYQTTRRFEAGHPDDAVAVFNQWRQYQAWHPTRNLFRPEAARYEAARLAELQQEARSQERAQRLNTLQRQIADPDFDGEALWPQFRQLVAEFPESSSHEIEPIRLALLTRRAEQISRRARAGFDGLVSSEARHGDLQALLAQADRFLSDYPGSAHELEVRRRRAAYVLRLDERDIEPARAFSAKFPLDFALRREHYQRYLDRHPGGAFAAEANAALAAIDLDWDRHDFRQLRDLFEANPGNIAEVVHRCREYQVRHPQGRASSAVADLLRWTEQVTAPREYRVVLRAGEFEPGQARWFSRGLKLSVELEVNGVPYGPSTIVKNTNAPEWNYEFPRYIRWKLGDSVRIRVTDHTWKDRVVFEVASADGDLVGMKLFTGEVWHGKNRLSFETDFALPVLPAVE